MRDSWMVLVLLLVACGGGGEDDPPDAQQPLPDAAVADALVVPPPDAATEAMAMVGPAGGEVELPGQLTMELPAGAVDESTAISVTLSTATAPGGALTPVYDFEPDGIVFARPVKVSFQLPAGITSADVYWSRPGAPGVYDNIGGTVSGNTVEAEVMHFSGGYAGPAATTRTVTGSQLVGWVSASGFQLVPADLSGFAVAALVDDGLGGYTVIDGAGTAAGTFVIDAVPDGPYWLRVPARFGGTAYYLTESSAIDAGHTSQGRPGLVDLTTQTNVELNLAGLAAWADGDTLEIFSTEAASWYFSTELAASAGVPTAGATGLVDYTFDMATAWAGTPHLIDGTRTPPDRLVIAQLHVAQTTGGVVYKAMSRIFETTVTLVAGETKVLEGAFTDVALDHTVTLDLRVTAFRALLDEEARACDIPDPRPFPSTAYVLGVAGGLGHGITGNTADFLLLDFAHDGPDILAENMAYGTPLAGTWGTYGDVRIADPCEIQLAGTDQATLFPGGSGFHVMLPLAAFGSAPVQPVIGQVRAPTIAGMDLYAPSAGVGLTPTLAWTAPSVGTADFYDVRVVRLFVDGDNRTAQENIASFRTPSTGLRLPGGVLVADEKYVILISARRSGVADPAAVDREVLPEHHATVVSAILQP